MEIMAVLEALRATEGPVTIVSDSTYVVNCFRDRWWVRWQANGWRNAKKEPVANADLWKPLIDLVQQRQPEFRWVKGHSGDRMNDLVDRLAVAAAIRPADGPTPSAAPAPAPAPPADSRPASASAPAPAPARPPAQDSLF
jgi:ribonuclease HI